MRTALLAMLLAGAIGGGILYAQTERRIYVGPNIRVSADSEKSHFEPMLASAENGVLIASANLTGGDDDAWITKAYVSRDNGNSWISVWFPRLIGSDASDGFVSGDSTVAAGAHGRLFYAALCRRSPETHEIVTCLYHSDDRGRSWSALKILNVADHERFLTEPSSGLVIIVGKGEGKQERLVMYVSHDDGSTFSGPLVYARVLGIAYDPCLLPIGILFLPFVHETRKSEYLEGVLVRDYRDISKPFKLYRESRVPVKALIGRNVERLLAGTYATESLPVFLAHGKTLYVVGSEYVNGAYRLVLRTSVTLGRSWSAPRYISVNGGKRRDQFAPSAAFNSGGVLGIAWSEMTGGTGYDERFTASLDGGKTFMPARIVSTHDSMPFNDENVAGATVSAGKDAFFQYSGFTTRSAGGDYFGMAADEAGAFHPLWIDSRDGTGAQLYTSSVAILDRPPSCTPASAGSVDLSKLVKLTFDPARMDVATGILTMPLRLRNIGDAAITGPVTFTVKALQTDEYIPPKAMVPKSAVPRVVGASNGKTGLGATLDFSRSFGDFGVLPPGHVSNAIDLRLQLSNPLLADPVITGILRGRICEK